MKLKDTYNAEQYLKEDQYYPYEIYYIDDISYNLFYPNQNCEKILDGYDDELEQKVVLVRTKVRDTKCSAILVFWIKENLISDAKAFYETDEDVLKIIFKRWHNNDG